MTTSAPSPSAIRYQLRVACRDADDLNQTLRAIRREAGAGGTETRIVLRSSSFERPPRPGVDRDPLSGT
jgi:hypothetical protein